MAEQQLTGRLLAAGRALAGISRADLSSASGTPLEEVQLLEANSARLGSRSARRKPAGRA